MALHFLLSKINKLDSDFSCWQILSLVCPIRDHVTLHLSHQPPRSAFKDGGCRGPWSISTHSPLARSSLSYRVSLLGFSLERGNQVKNKRIPWPVQSKGYTQATQIFEFRWTVGHWKLIKMAACKRTVWLHCFDSLQLFEDL